MSEQCFEFVNDFLTFESRQATELQIENRLRLNVRKSQSADDAFQIFQESGKRFVGRNAAPVFDFVQICKIARQKLFRFINRTRIAYQRNDVIERVNRLVQAFQNMRSRVGFAKLELGSSPNNLTSELDKG